MSTHATAREAIAEALASLTPATFTQARRTFGRTQAQQTTGISSTIGVSRRTVQRWTPSGAGEKRGPGRWPEGSPQLDRWYKTPPWRRLQAAVAIANARDAGLRIRCRASIKVSSKCGPIVTMPGGTIGATLFRHVPGRDLDAALDAYVDDDDALEGDGEPRENPDPRALWVPFVFAYFELPMTPGVELPAVRCGPAEWWEVSP